MSVWAQTQGQSIQIKGFVTKIEIRTENWGTMEVCRYRKFPKYSDTQKICCNHSKILIVALP